MNDERKPKHWEAVKAIAAGTDRLSVPSPESRDAAARQIVEEADALLRAFEEHWQVIREAETHKAIKESMEERRKLFSKREPGDPEGTAR